MDKSKRHDMKGNQPGTNRGTLYNFTYVGSLKAQLTQMWRNEMVISQTQRVI